MRLIVSAGFCAIDPNGGEPFAHREKDNTIRKRKLLRIVLT